jgi:hypothetical protein
MYVGMDTHGRCKRCFGALCLTFVTFGCAARPSRIGLGTVEAQGRAFLYQTGTLDLDASVEAQASAGLGGADLWFRAVTEGEMYLQTWRKSRIALLPSGEDCGQVRFRESRLDIRNLPIGTAFCINTNEEAIAEVRVLGIDRAKNKQGVEVSRLTLSYVTRHTLGTR